MVAAEAVDAAIVDVEASVAVVVGVSDVEHQEEAEHPGAEGSGAEGSVVDGDAVVDTKLYVSDISLLALTRTLFWNCWPDSQVSDKYSGHLEPAL